VVSVKDEDSPDAPPLERAIAAPTARPNRARIPYFKNRPPPEAALPAAFAPTLAPFLFPAID
jgi:hypothetical protein